MTATAVPATIAAARGRPAPRSLLRRSLSQPRMRAGIVLTALVLIVALVGPFVAPHSAGDIVGSPFAGTSGSMPLGTDYIGQDVYSRVLRGGVSVVWISVAATVLGVGLGAAVGLSAAYLRGFFDDLLMRSMDVVLSIPSIVMVLVIVAVKGPSEWLLALLVGISWIPQVARVTRGAAVEVVSREFVEAVEMIGVPWHKIVRRDVLPNIMTPLMVEAGLRLTWSIALVASVSFLGDGIQPPAADWGLMIKENYEALSFQPWGVLAPIICIAVFTIGTNLMTEGLAREVAGVRGRQRPKRR